MVNYIPIVRSEAQRRSVKFLTNDLAHITHKQPVIPLYENYLPDVLSKDISALNSFDSIFVDYPHYLEQDPVRGNYFSPNRSIVNVADEIVNLGYQDKFVPVISQETYLPFPYAGISMEFADKKKKLENMGYDKVGFRIFFGPETANQLQLADDFIKIIDPDDVIFIDNIGYDANIECILANIQSFINLMREKEKSNPIYILNFLNVRPLHDNGRITHNFGPLVSLHFSLQGFGDTLVEAKLTPEGVRNTQNTRQRGYVKVYDYSRQDLVEVLYNKRTDTPAQSVVRDARAGSVVSNHTRMCQFCNNFSRGLLVSQTQLKEYRNGHYVVSLVKNVLPAIQAASSPSDFDEEGADFISNIINGRMPSGC